MWPIIVALSHIPRLKKCGPELSTLPKSKHSLTSVHFQFAHVPLCGNNLAHSMPRCFHIHRPRFESPNVEPLIPSSSRKWVSLETSVKTLVKATLSSLKDESTDGWWLVLHQEMQEWMNRSFCKNRTWKSLDIEECVSMYIRMFRSVWCWGNLNAIICYWRTWSLDSQQSDASDVPCNPSSSMLVALRIPFSSSTWLSSGRWPPCWIYDLGM